MPPIAKPSDAREALGGAGDRTFWTPCTALQGAETRFVLVLFISGEINPEIAMKSPITCAGALCAQTPPLIVKHILSSLDIHFSDLASSRFVHSESPRRYLNRKNGILLKISEIGYLCAFVQSSIDLTLCPSKIHS
jgi:hypothetical protein